MSDPIEIPLPGRTRVRLPSGTVVETGGLAGSATSSPGRTSGLRSRRGEVPTDGIDSAVLQALAKLGIQHQETITLDVKLPRGTGGMRGQAAADRIVVEAAPPLLPGSQFVLYRDESGGLSWHLPDSHRASGRPSARQTRARSGSARFTIPSRTVAAQSAARTGTGAHRLRGPLASLGRKVLKVFVIPLLSPALGPPLEAIVGAAERKYRQELIRSLRPENYRLRVRKAFTNWNKLAAGRSLLVVHGIFSSTEGVLSQLPEPAMRELDKHYDGRMIAFDQLTVSRGPKENAKFFLEQALQGAGGKPLEFDVLCHSRGGIVARTLAERGHELVPGHNCSFSKVFFVATPNRGSVLADADHIVDMVDTFTNLFTSFPDGPTSTTIEIVLAVLKLLVHSAETQLPGLAAMGTSGYIKELNRAVIPSPAEYAAAAASYSPDPLADNGFIAGRFADSVIDRVFRDGDTDVPNDLVVPYEGVFGPNGHPSFAKLKPRLLFGPNDHVWHTGFFARAETFAAIKEHFGIAGGEPASLAADGSLPAPSVVLDDADLEGVIGGAGFIGTEIAATETFGTVGAAPPTGPPSPRRPRPRLRDRSGLFEPRPAAAHRRARRPTTADSARPISADSAPTAALRRDPHIDFHEVVEEGRTNTLTVRLEDLAASANSPDALTIVLEAGASQAEIHVTLSAPGFDVEAIGEPRMTVKRRRSARLERVQFALTARSPGETPIRREILVTFWLRNSCIGAVGHYTYVVPKNFAGSWPSDGSSFSAGFAVPTSRRDDCDLAISVQGEDEAGLPPLRITLSSEIQGHEYRDLFAGKLLLDAGTKTLAQYLDEFYSDQFRKYPGDDLDDTEFAAAYSSWQHQFHSSLTALGKKLWTFLPQQFRVEYFRLHDAGVAPRSILVHSDEMILPWELIVPHRSIGGRLEEMLALGQRHVLGRWKPGLPMKPQPQRLSVRKFCVVNPKYPEPDTLPSSEEEVKNLRQLLPKISVITPANFATFEANVLQQPDVQVLHFSGHGDYDPRNSDLNHLLLEGSDTLGALLVTGSRLATEGSPIVYLNACHVGNTGAVVGRMGGFGANLLTSGCSGVIAPYWPVDDVRAAEFSLALYSRLAKGEAVGVALRDLRCQHPDDPTYCAFAYFGDPWARLDLTALA